MKTSPEVEKYLDSARTSARHLSQMSVAEGRQLQKDLESEYAWDPGVDVDSRDVTMPVEGGSIPLRIYTPPGGDKDGPLPTFVYIHGGGWVLGWVDSLDCDALCRYLCAEATCVVVSVGYRLAPEHKFPVPAEDCYAALDWVVRNAAALNGDSSRLAVGGESAGGNLTAAACLMARDRKWPALSFQVPMYPVADFRFDSGSYKLYGKGYGLDTEDMEWFWRHYLRDGEDGSNPYASPLRAADFRGLPPALVVTAGLDPLRDEGELYGEKLRAAGVPTRVWRIENVPHGVLSLPFGGEERRELAAELRRAFISASASGSPRRP